MLGIAIFFIILGILIKYGKMYSLIAGYNTMPAKKKAEYNIEGIATVFRNSMFGMAFIVIGGYFAADYLENPDIKNIALYGSLLIGIPYLLIRSNSRKFKDHEKPTDNKSK